MREKEKRRLILLKLQLEEKACSYLPSTQWVNRGKRIPYKWLLLLGLLASSSEKNLAYLSLATGRADYYVTSLFGTQDCPLLR